MKLTPLQTIVLLVILAGVIFGTYSATVAQLPNLTGTVVGNTTNNANTTNQTIGTIYLADDSNKTNTSLIIKNNTEIYKLSKDNKEVKTDLSQLKNGSKIDVYTEGDPTNTIPPQITTKKIVIKQK